MITSREFVNSQREMRHIFARILPLIDAGTSGRLMRGRGAGFDDAMLPR